MQRVPTRLLIGCTLAALAAPALGEGLHKERVPATAQIVVHLDVEALLASRLASEMKAVNADFDVDFDLGKDSPLFAGVRPLREVRSLTLFSTDPAHQRFGAVLRTSSKADSVLQLAIAADEYEQVPLAGWQVHSWRNGEQRVYGAVLPLEGSDDRLVLVTNDAQAMSQGIAVLDGSGQSLSSRSTGQLAARPEPGVIVFVASDVPLSDLGDADPTSSVARLVQGLVLQMGETQGEVFANLAVVTARPEDAQRVQQVLQGLSALASLVSEEAEQGKALQRLIGALRFQTTGSQLYAEFRYDLASLLRDLESLQREGEDD